jgi:hypothetical protein
VGVGFGLGFAGPLLPPQPVNVIVGKPSSASAAPTLIARRFGSNWELMKASSLAIN